MQIRVPLALFLFPLLLTACSSAYYSTMERFGVDKRDILVDRVENARDAQEEAKEQFNTAFEQFTALMDYDGGDLEAFYDDLNDSFEESERRAEVVRDRIDAVESVSVDLFDEWEDELDLYSNPSLRESSAQTLRTTRTRYQQLIGTMRAAEQTMEPVLSAFRDQVLFLRHNLNSQAISSLRTEVAGIQNDVSALISEMEQSIAESDQFLRELELI